MPEGQNHRESDTIVSRTLTFGKNPIITTYNNQYKPQASSYKPCRKANLWDVDHHPPNSLVGEWLHPPRLSLCYDDYLTSSGPKAPILAAGVKHKK